uniref:L27 domain-containing protein n=1 Tax=Anopheles minimus TaxID=112268 RepID=A0A182W635_9DIPT
MLFNRHLAYLYGLIISFFFFFFFFAAEAHRALELLEDYHSRLSTPQDRALRSAIERVIRIFKSRLFQALLDIQEFYELTLLDESKTVQQKTAETLLIASKWEQDNAIKANEVSMRGQARESLHVKSDPFYNV